MVARRASVRLARKFGYDLSDPYLDWIEDHTPTARNWLPSGAGLWEARDELAPDRPADSPGWPGRQGPASHPAKSPSTDLSPLDPLDVATATSEAPASMPATWTVITWDHETPAIGCRRKPCTSLPACSPNRIRRPMWCIATRITSPRTAARDGRRYSSRPGPRR